MKNTLPFFLLFLFCAPSLLRANLPCGGGGCSGGCTCLANNGAGPDGPSGPGGPDGPSGPGGPGAPGPNGIRMRCCRGRTTFRWCWSCGFATP